MPLPSTPPLTQHRPPAPPPFVTWAFPCQYLVVTAALPLPPGPFKRQQTHQPIQELVAKLPLPTRSPPVPDFLPWPSWSFLILPWPLGSPSPPERRTELREERNECSGLRQIGSRKFSRYDLGTPLPPSLGKVFLIGPLEVLSPVPWYPPLPRPLPFLGPPSTRRQLQRIGKRAHCKNWSQGLLAPSSFFPFARALAPSRLLSLLSPVTAVAWVARTPATWPSS